MFSCDSVRIKSKMRIEGAISLMVGKFSPPCSLATLESYLYSSARYHEVFAAYV